MFFVLLVLYQGLSMIALAEDGNDRIVKKDLGSCTDKVYSLLQVQAVRNREIIQSGTNTLTVPEHIRQLGGELFGHDADEMFSMTGSFNLNLSSNHAITMYTRQGDYAIPVLQAEAPHDSYKIARLASSPDTGHGNQVVVDIGANLGTFVINAFLTNPRLCILALEPMPMTFLYLKWNMYNNGIPEITEDDFHAGKAGVLVMQRAATNNGRDIEVEYNPRGSVLGVTAASRSDHHLHHDEQGTDGITTVVPSVNVPIYLAGEHVHFLKIDCEGCEHEVVPDMKSTGFLETVDFLAGEVHQCHSNDTCTYSPEIVNATLATMQEHPGSGGAVFFLR